MNPPFSAASTKDRRTTREKRAAPPWEDFLGKQGTAWGITADLADRAQVEAVPEQLASGHADATLLVDAAGFFIPKPFLEYDAAFYDPSSTHIPKSLLEER
jgi:NADP-dependent 3-hydroxy acid dehydrogenase YdfG